MSEYRLQPDEVQLYHNSITLCDEHGKSLSKAASTLTLTNKNIVITNRTKKLFGKEEVNVDVHPIGNVKVYNEAPQLKQNGSIVDVFLTTGELHLLFPSKSEGWKFITQATELITGKTIAERGASKIRSALNLVDDTLGINTVDTVKDVLEHGVAGILFGKKK